MRSVLRVALCCLLVVLAGCSGTGVAPTETPDNGTADGTTADGTTATPAPVGSDVNGTLSVHFLNVGQGDATLLVAPTGETTLVDTGDYEDDGERVVDVHADAAGHDGGNLNGEYVVFENAGERPLALSGWTVRDEAGHEYAFGDVTLAPGERLTLHTGSGSDTATDLYWGSDGPLWNNDGDTVTVETANGERVVTASYE